MSPIQQVSLDSFSKDTINEHLQKILADPLFAVSDILKRFLTFIVDETLAGHANQLKEYTIGVKVLHKPADFKPQHDAIVRIHAGRLRRALHQYYKSAGAEEFIHITIPKGSYVPVFGDRNEISEEINAEHHEPAHVHKNGVIAVMPFRHHGKHGMKTSFSDGLGVQLSTELTSFKNFSVIAYFSVSRLAEKLADIKELASVMNAQYVVTGDIQSQGNRMRINVQLINTETTEQMWSQMYEYKLTASNMFDIQDKVIREIVGMFEASGLAVKKAMRTSMIAVA